MQERLEREYGMDLITTAPTVVYQVVLRDGSIVEIENPSKLPDPAKIEEIREPIILATIIVPQDYVGPVMTLCNQKRGTQKNMQYAGRQVILTYEMPLNEIVNIDGLTLAVSRAGVRSTEGTHKRSLWASA